MRDFKFFVLSRESVMPCIFCSCLIRAAMVSTVITNRSDDSGHPCRIPREIFNGADIQPLFIILHVVLLYIVFTHCMKELLNPKYSKVVNIKFLSSVSKALAKSRNKIEPWTSNFSAWSIMS